LAGTRRLLAARLLEDETLLKRAHTALEGCGLRLKKALDIIGGSADP
jgi:hypothetical protein